MTGVVMDEGGKEEERSLWEEGTPPLYLPKGCLPSTRGSPSGGTFLPSLDAKSSDER